MILEERFASIDICKRSRKHSDNQTWEDGQGGSDAAELGELTLDRGNLTVPLIDEAPRGGPDDRRIVSAVMLATEAQFQDANFRSGSHVATKIGDEIEEAAQQDRSQKEEPLRVMFGLGASRVTGRSSRAG
ncbi:MAG: hypothetical protein L6R42_004857 [Xanthoria sp. 1 TBL-2021]|nr:MAG: hypothetical protein L6R42_004857 [Xanthoria sp. 1 TBL-2021]